MMSTASFICPNCGLDRWRLCACTRQERVSAAGRRVELAARYPTGTVIHRRGALLAVMRGAPRHHQVSVYHQDGVTLNVDPLALFDDPRYPCEVIGQFPTGQEARDLVDVRSGHTDRLADRAQSRAALPEFTTEQRETSALRRKLRAQERRARKGGAA